MELVAGVNERQAGPEAHWIGFDIGGTDIKFAVFDRNARIVHHRSAATPRGAHAGQLIPEAVHDILIGLIKDYSIVNGVGISTAGVVDPDTGEIVYAGPTIPGYRGTNLKAAIQDRFRLPVHILNDVNAAALGERWKGAARESEHFFCMTLGTGIGGAFFCEGRLVTGPHFRAGEIGHSLYDPRTGTTYEQRASMSALLNRAADSLADFSGAGAELFARAKEGDAACRRLIRQWAKQVARGLADISLLLDPELIVIGGGVSAQKENLLQELRKHMAAYLPDGFPQAELRTAELGNKAALYGAVFPYYQDNKEKKRRWENG